MPNGYLALAFIGGFLIGVISCWLLATKLLKNNKMLDELTRTKRDLASAHRVLDEFFKTSGNLFAQLDKDYRHYARFMSKAAQRLTTNEEELFLTDNEVEYDSEENYSSGRMQTRDIERDAMSLTPERETYRSRRAEKAAPASARETAETAVQPKAQKAIEPQAESEEEELRAPEKKVEKKIEKKSEKKVIEPIDETTVQQIAEETKREFSAEEEKRQSSPAEPEVPTPAARVPEDVPAADPEELEREERALRKTLPDLSNADEVNPPNSPVVLSGTEDLSPLPEEQPKRKAAENTTI